METVKVRKKGGMEQTEIKKKQGNKTRRDDNATRT